MRTAVLALLGRTLAREATSCSGRHLAANAATTSSRSGVFCQMYTTSTAQEDAQGLSSTDHKANIGRLLYRSRQRGLLELDLLLGVWATEHIPRMNATQLDQYAALLSEENPDLFKWITNQQEPPAHVQSNPIFQAVQREVAAQVARLSPAASRANDSRPWLHGWSDINK